MDVGVLINAVPGNDYCNGIIANDRTKSFVGACLCDCLHVDDLAGLLKERVWTNGPLESEPSMTGEQYRARTLAMIKKELSHRILLGLSAQDVEMAESAQVFFSEEITPEQLEVLASRVHT